MNMEKYDYWQWANVIDNNQIKEINSICEKYHEPSFKDNNAEDVVKTANIKGIRWEFLKSPLHYVNEMWRTQNKFSFGFNIFESFDIDLWNINIYDSKNEGEYKFHFDASHDNINDVKLTGIVNISDEPYEGGEFIIYENEEILGIKNPGSSLLLKHGILHKVNPVTKGKRKTLSFWFHGPRFI